VHDRRVKAVFAMAPGVMQGFGFDGKGLRELRIPTYLIIGEGDTITPSKENAGFVAKHATNAKLRIIPGPVGHEIFLNECDEEGKAEFPETCVDDPSLDRATVHKLIAGDALNFFDTHLKGL
jgi:predicted dienelactone hydrolase